MRNEKLEMLNVNNPKWLIWEGHTSLSVFVFLTKKKDKITFSQQNHTNKQLLKKCDIKVQKC